MNKQIKRFCATVIMMIIIVAVCNQFSYARIAANWRECANTTSCTDDGTTTILNVYSISKNQDSNSYVLRTYIVQSTRYFLKSHAAYQEFLNRVEVIDYEYVNDDELKELLYSVIEYIEKAKSSYCSFKSIADSLPYNQNIIDRLKMFDYDGFQVKFGLVESIYSKLKSLLMRGDIIGFDNALIANMDSILNKLNEIKSAVDKEQLPEITLLWRTNQAYSEAQLFAQYMSEVFRAILF